jgi:hypothetical protein
VRFFVYGIAGPAVRIKRVLSLFGTKLRHNAKLRPWPVRARGGAHERSVLVTPFIHFNLLNTTKEMMDSTSTDNSSRLSVRRRASSKLKTAPRNDNWAIPEPEMPQFPSVFETIENVRQYRSRIALKISRPKPGSTSVFSVARFFFFFFFWLTPRPRFQPREIYEKMLLPTECDLIKDRRYHLRTYKKCFIGTSRSHRGPETPRHTTFRATPSGGDFGAMPLLPSFLIHFSCSIRDGGMVCRAGRRCLDSRARLSLWTTASAHWLHFPRR